MTPNQNPAEAEAAVDATRASVEVTTPSGTVRGIQREGSAAFLGIPFAAPPVGSLRFAAPEPFGAWDGVRDAARHAATPQRKTLQEVTIIPEPSIPGDSTLNVDVFTPSPGDTGAGLPVLVYIHGGGYVAGSPASPWYDGAAFNRDGVVTVNVSYRLGFDGFGWIEDAPHNRGVLDWILALEWVRDHIRSFGGDPGRVTIAGQSAGGGAVLTLLGVPRAAELFHGAISLSGPASGVALEDAERLGRRIAEQAGVPPTRAGLSSVDELRIIELQNQAAPIGGGEDDPLAAVVAFASDGLSLGPVVDGDLIPEPALTALARGMAADKRLLAGATDNEFNMVLAQAGDALSAVDPVVALARLGLDPAVAEEYSASHAALGTAGILGQFVTDRVFRVHARELGEVRAAVGAPTWLYRFSWPSPVFAGATHCLDVPFFFDCLGAERVEAVAGAEAPDSLVADVHGAAVQFIRSGDPGWDAYTVPARRVRVYDVPSRVADDGYADVAILGEAAAVSSS